MIGRGTGILLAVLLCVSACRHTDPETADIRKVLGTRAAAINSRDVPLYLQTLSPRYSDKGKNFTQLKESLEKNFRDFEQISYDTDTPSIRIDGSSAVASDTYRMKIKVRGKEIALNGTERLTLAKEPGGWKIIAGI